MKLYFAGAESDMNNLAQCGVKKILLSMANAESKIKTVGRYFDNYEMIIDSGAFTYFKKGGISLDEWIKKATELKGYGNELISLDVIGNAKHTFENYNIISKSIKGTIPTFHIGSDLEYFKKYLGITDRIAIGGMVLLGSQSNKLENGLNQIFKILDNKNLPRLHAFGIFNENLLKKFPFYSCDASTWNGYVKFRNSKIFNGINYKRTRNQKEISLNRSSINRNELNLVFSNTRFQMIKNECDQLLKFENFLTDLWTKRGIVWNE